MDINDKLQKIIIRLNIISYNYNIAKIHSLFYDLTQNNNNHQ